MKKLVLLSFYLSIAILLLVGCSNKIKPVENGKTTESIAGDYYVMSCKDEQSQELELDGEQLHLDADGKGYFVIAEEQFSLNWELNGHDFTFVDSEGDQFIGTYYDGLIQGTYYDGYQYMFTNDKELAESFDLSDTIENPGNPSLNPAISPGNTHISGNNNQQFYTMQWLYEPTYGIKVAQALVPYGWNASVNVEWGLCSSMYPALATIKMTSPDGQAVISMQSTFGYMQMARNGSWVPEGTYLDLYNVYLNYRNAHNYNDYILGILGYKGTIVSSVGPSYDYQLLLNEGANAYASALASGTGGQLLGAEGTTEKTSYFITQGDAYHVDIESSVIMTHFKSGLFESYQWIVPYAAVLTTYSEEAYAEYASIFDNVIQNTSYSNNFTYVVQKNAQYINEMIHNYLMEKVYTPSSGEIGSWAGEYNDDGQDRFINAWCDVIKEQNEYTTTDGSSIKVPTAYDSVYQDGEYIYMGPESQAPQGWQQLNKVEY